MAKMNKARSSLKVVSLKASIIDDDYIAWMQTMKDRVRAACYRAQVAANQEMLLLYWDLGHDIIERQQRQGWGNAIILRMSADLIAEFPEMKGFSERNLGYMKRFASVWTREAILQAPLAKLSWFCYIALLEQLKDQESRLAYAVLCAEQLWQRPQLVAEIKRGAITNFCQASNNFGTTMQIADADLAIKAIRDRYNLEFLGVTKKDKENKVRRTLVERVARFMLELGAGFTYAGQERKIDVGGNKFSMDLLFYNVRIHRYFVIELKTRKFRPQDVGQLGFYMTAIDEQVRNPQIEGETVGILLCKSRNRIVVEYALKNFKQPIAVSTYELEQMGLSSAQALTDGLTKAIAVK